MEAVRRGTREPKRWDKGSVHLALLHQQVLWSIIISLGWAGVDVVLEIPCSGNTVQSQASQMLIVIWDLRDHWRG